MSTVEWLELKRKKLQADTNSKEGELSMELGMFE